MQPTASRRVEKPSWLSDQPNAAQRSQPGWLAIENTAQDRMTLLTYLQEQSGPAPNLKTCTQPVSYTDGKQKHAYLDAAKDTPAFSDYNNCHTISKALKEYRARQGTVFVFIVNLGPAVETEGQEDQPVENDSSWHSLVVCIKNHVVGIYDPSYVAKATTQLHSLRNMKLVTEFLYTMTKKKPTYKLTGDVFVSGGGNDGTKCNEMCRLWLIDQLITQEGRNIGNWEALGWDKYRANYVYKMALRGLAGFESILALESRRTSTRQ
ncbi:hypothetical protein FN846DRAFT_989126 [Sphaerosporella brunnea]|uniref:Uncharacterized protein n=1 Tax=Sphaerosporella brunnea TaxID=1250544 RepID=A0A5J5EQJ3_9PEZI|nr:hypothetical protein FN846DRAFT_989126 [Sphaerosporella brunnea]